MANVLPQAFRQISGLSGRSSDSSPESTNGRSTPNAAKTTAIQDLDNRWSGAMNSGGQIGRDLADFSGLLFEHQPLAVVGREIAALSRFLQAKLPA